MRTSNTSSRETLDVFVCWTCRTWRKGMVVTKSRPRFARWQYWVVLFHCPGFVRAKAAELCLPVLPFDRLVNC